MSGNSTRKSRSRKAAERPSKPYPTFPLSPHPSGKWQKRILGHIYYFGTWAKRVNGQLVRVEGDGWKEALELYKAQADDLHAGRTPRVKTDELNVKDLGERFMRAKYDKLASGELGKRSFEEYRATCQLLADIFGKDRRVADLAADDFQALRAEMAKRWGPVRLSNAITRVKSVFKFGEDNGLTGKPHYGSEFKKPGKAILRKHRASNGVKMLEADELRKLIAVAPSPLKAMILLGLNAGFGNNDASTLPLSAVDLEKGWVDFPRPKTGIARRSPLWLESIDAIREMLANRPMPTSDADKELVFLQRSGRRWVRDTEKSRTDNISVQFAALLKELGLYREGIGFYTLRHVFRTVADAARDPVAIDLIMGHSDPTMGGHYRERVEDSRLQAVVQVVHDWLFGKTQDEPAGKREIMPTEQADDDEPTPPATTSERPQLKLFAG